VKRTAALAIVMLTACDRVFGLVSAQLADGPPPDGPPHCPVMPGAPPKFSPVLHQSVARDCSFYTTSDVEDLATALCTDPMTGQLEPDSGSIDLSLSKITLNSQFARASIASLKLAPGTDDLWVVQSDANNPANSEVAVFARSDATTWAWRSTVFALPSAAITTSPPASTPTGRHVLVLTLSNTITEWKEISPGSWMPVHSYNVVDLGVLQILSDVFLSRDGLRMSFIGQVQTGIDNPYAICDAERTDADSPFGQAHPIEGAPLSPGFDVQFPFLTHDCGRLYFNALGQIMYLNLSY
jgi:hypothetical protein